MVKRILIVCALVLLGAGCQRHYRVTDPQSGKTYYTKDVDRRAGGAATFKDAGSGDKVTLQSSEVKKISREEYERAVPAK
jgi:hypothetical protein